MKYKNHNTLHAHDQFYEYRKLEDKLKYLLKYAQQAPSRNNTQPWRFEVTSDQIKIYADFSKQLYYTDPNNRELYISLGCAIANLELAAEFYQIHYSTYIFTGEPINNLVAIINFSNTLQPKHIYPVPLFHDILQRHTDRNPYSLQSIDNEDLENLSNVISWLDGVYLYLTNKQTIKAYAANLVYQAESQQFNTPSFRDEQTKWIKSRSQKEGMPLSAFYLSKLNSLIFKVYKNFNYAQKKPQADAQLVKNAPYIAILMTDSDTKTDWITAGVAFQILALRATELKIAYQPMTAIIEVPYTREKIKDIVESSKIPQMLFRLGYSSASFN